MRDMVRPFQGRNIFVACTGGGAAVAPLPPLTPGYYLNPLRGFYRRALTNGSAAGEEVARVGFGVEPAGEGGLGRVAFHVEDAVLEARVDGEEDGVAEARVGQLADDAPRVGLADERRPAAINFVAQVDAERN